MNAAMRAGGGANWGTGGVWLAANARKRGKVLAAVWRDPAAVSRNLSTHANAGLCLRPPWVGGATGASARRA